MNTPPVLTDTATLRHRRARASEMLLQQAAMDEVRDRLAMVNKTFTTAKVVSPFPDLWTQMLPGVSVVPDDEVLDLEVSAQDLIVHSLSLHWANDPLGQLIQCRRSLRPDGLLLATALGGQTLHELRAALSQAEAEVSGGLSPRVAPMAEVRDLGALLQRAGLALPVADVVPMKVSYGSMFDLMRDLRSMGETNALDGRLRRPTARSVFLRAAELYHNAFGTPDGRILATFDLIVLTGWAPADDQPQPLRPGSAKSRLADALGTDETKLRD